MAVSNLTIDKRSPFSMQRQLATQLVHLIRSGSLKPGEQLPTVRQLAGYLRINHNTVALAYRELEAQGLLRVEQGRGTFATEAGASGEAQLHARCHAIVSEAFERARAEGASGAQFLEAATAVVQMAERPDGPPVHILLAECNTTDVEVMRRSLAPELGGRISTATVEELGARLAGGRQALADVDLVVTTFFHVNEVETMTEGTGLKVAGLYMGPSIRTLMRIMALPPEARIGAVGVSPACARGLVASLRNVLGNDRPIAFGHVLEPERLPETLSSCEVVVYADGSQEVVEGALRPAHERILVEKQIDHGSIEMVKELAADLARRKGPVAVGGAG